MDQELIAYLDTRFREVSQQITGLRGEVGGLRGEVGDLRGEVGDLRGEVGDLRGELGGLRGELGDLRGELGGLRGEFESFRAETGRNFDRVDEDIRETGVMVENVRDEVKFVAEGVKGANERLDAFKADVAQEFKDVRSLIHLSYKDLDRRIRRSDEDAEGLKI